MDPHRAVGHGTAKQRPWLRLLLLLLLLHLLLHLHLRLLCRHCLHTQRHGQRALMVQMASPSNAARAEATNKYALQQCHLLGRLAGGGGNAETLVVYLVPSRSF